ncbi:MAG: undecaprenyldiphospho-muramoylpentapeptide beta-N-acetylglucosaminyltransferase [Desulfuromonas sp.]|nr:MAG: undecaprenyldiphospho-muramoylpentapeptide beta-N-acetylglucosaminyltransferase [Desulfuromonas sp.]
MKLLLAGGGTGGHLFPAVALGQMLLDQEQQAEVLFVGTERGLESRLLPKLGLPLKTVDMVGVVGRGWRGKLELVPKLVKSLLQSRRILRQFRPDVVIGVGGYVTVPVLLAAKLAGIPYLIHEQNAFPGLSNRVLGKWARLVCLSFPDSGSGFAPQRVKVTGNPLRAGFEEIPEQLATNGKLLIFGGSRGARAINQNVMAMLPLLKDMAAPPTILHQTGEEDLEQVRAAYRDAGYENAEVVPFIDDMASAYRDAALVICRAGATTLAELTVCGRPALLIPYPYAAADHQTANARMLEKAGAAKVIIQSELTPAGLATVACELLNSPETLQQMASAGRRLGLPGAAEKILAECRALTV